MVCSFSIVAIRKELFIFFPFLESKSDQKLASSTSSLLSPKIKKIKSQQKDKIPTQEISRPSLEKENANFSSSSKGTKKSSTKKTSRDEKSTTTSHSTISENSSLNNKEENEAQKKVVILQASSQPSLHLNVATTSGQKRKTLRRIKSSSGIQGIASQSAEHSNTMARTPRDG
jgi:archaellum component FlaD/FlaE